MIDGAAHGSSHTQRGHHNDADTSVGGMQQCRSGCSDASTLDLDVSRVLSRVLIPHAHRKLCCTHSCRHCINAAVGYHMIMHVSRDSHRQIQA